MRCAAGVVALWLGLAGGAAAHAFLDHAVPPVGGTVAAPPAEIRLGFSEAIEGRFSTIELYDAAEHRVATDPAVRDPARETELVLKLTPLPPGRYRVRWRVVSVDTHRTEGDYVFEIKP
jgi:methionine-rich copper-binding protein CopC